MGRGRSRNAIASRAWRAWRQSAAAGRADSLVRLLAEGFADRDRSRSRRLRIFVMGANRWRDEYEWPLARTQFMKFYLQSDGRANRMPATVDLEWIFRRRNHRSDRFVYDPERPCLHAGRADLDQSGSVGPQDRQIGGQARGCAGLSRRIRWRPTRK